MKCAECNKEACYSVMEELEQSCRESAVVLVWKHLCKKHYEERK